MKTAILTDEHRELFAEMDPFFFLERGELPNRVCIGAVMEGGEGAFDDPAGLMVLCIEREAVTVEWICVRGKYRMQKVGSALMAIAFRAAHDAGHDKLFMYVNKEYGRKDVCLYENAFISDYGFEKTEDLPGEFTAELEEIEESGLLDSYPDIPVLSLESLKGAERERFYEDLADLDEKCFMFDPAEAAEQADLTLSRVLYKGKELQGLIFLQNCGEFLYITGLWVKDCYVVPILCGEALSGAVKKYGKNKQVKLIKYTISLKKLVGMIFPGAPAKNSLYAAKVSDYYEKMSDRPELLRDMVLISGSALESEAADS